MSENCQQNEKSSTSKQTTNRPSSYKTYLYDATVKIPRSTLRNHRKRTLENDLVHNTLYAVHQDAEVNSSIPSLVPSPVPMEEDQTHNEDHEDEVIDDYPDNINYDLVKSHLMFAVREEVEVLKEKISELMDKINQLEIENSILKANASQETLSQLPTQHTSAPSTAVSNTTNNTQASIGPTNGQPP